MLCGVLLSAGARRDVVVELMCGEKVAAHLEFMGLFLYPRPVPQKHIGVEWWGDGGTELGVSVWHSILRGVMKEK